MLYSRSYRPLLLALATCPLVCLPALAQPQTESAEAIKVGQAEESARWAWRELQREMSGVELRAPEKAIAAYQKFYGTSGHLYLDVAVAVTSRIAQVWGRELKNPAKAGEIYAWALEQWGQTPYGERLQNEAAAMAKLGGVTPVEPVGGVGMAAVAPVEVQPMPMTTGGTKAAAPFEVQPMTMGLGGTNAPGAAPNVTFGGRTLALKVTLEAIRAGRLSVEEAWKSGSITVDDALLLLDGASAWGFLAGGDVDIATRRALGLLIAEQSPDVLREPKQLSPSVRLWMGDALGAKGDARGAELLESVLSELKTQAPLTTDQQALRAFVTSKHLAEIYSDGKQTEQAVATWLEVPKLLAEAPPSEKRWMVPESFLMVGRIYNGLGETEKARTFYIQVPPYGSGWVAALSLYERATPLLNQGKVKEAYQLMSQPLLLTSEVKNGTIAQQSWLASFAYRMGNLEAAMKHSQAALEAGGDGSALSSASIRSLYGMARDTNTRAGGWKNQPIQTDTKEIVFQANPSQPDKPLYARFRIKTYGDKSVTASVDNPNIQARVLPINNWQRDSLNAREEESEVIVQSNSLKTYTDVPLVLSSATRSKTTTVRVSLVDKSA